MMPMRASSILPLFLLASLAGACADAPITNAQLQDDGQLVPGSHSVALFAAETAVARQQASAIRVAGVLASQDEGALEDRAHFSERGDKAVHLHLRADGLPETWDAVFDLDSK